MQQNGNKTVFAVDINSQEMNPVERAYKIRDINLENGLLKIILREEEHKKHIKDGTLPKNTFNLPYGVISGINDHHENFLETVIEKRATITTGRGNPGHLANNRLISNVSDLEGDLSNPQSLVVNSENKNKKYCVCGKQYDQHFYVQCEDQCEWFHPECVGFDLQMIQKRT